MQENNTSSPKPKQASGWIFLVVGIVMLCVGNWLADKLEIIGTAMGLFGDGLIVYSLYLLARWAFGRKKSQDVSLPKTDGKV